MNSQSKECWTVPILIILFSHFSSLSCVCFSDITKWCGEDPHVTSPSTSYSRHTCWARLLGPRRCTQTTAVMEKESPSDSFPFCIKFWKLLCILVWKLIPQGSVFSLRNITSPSPRKAVLSKTYPSNPHLKISFKMDFYLSIYSKLSKKLMSQFSFLR